jgi:hypothetical protein
MTEMADDGKKESPTQQDHRQRHVSDNAPWWVDLASQVTGTRSNSAATIWLVLTAIFVVITIIVVIAVQ